MVFKVCSEATDNQEARVQSMFSLFSMVIILASVPGERILLLF